MMTAGEFPSNEECRSKPSSKMFAPRPSPASIPTTTTPPSSTIIIEMGTAEQNQTRLVVNEIFLSIQGESTYAGRPCAFVRLTGCNLRCNYCDTEYAFYEGHKMTVAEIIEQLDRYGCRLVEITGGEPLLQDGVHQ